MMKATCAYLRGGKKALLTPHVWEVLRHVSDIQEQKEELHDFADWSPDFEEQERWSLDLFATSEVKLRD